MNDVSMKDVLEAKSKPRPAHIIHVLPRTAYAPDARLAQGIEHFLRTFTQSHSASLQNSSVSYPSSAYSQSKPHSIVKSHSLGPSSFDTKHSFGAAHSHSLGPSHSHSLGLPYQQPHAQRHQRIHENPKPRPRSFAAFGALGALAEAELEREAGADRGEVQPPPPVYTGARPREKSAFGDEKKKEKEREWEDEKQSGDEQAPALALALVPFLLAPGVFGAVLRPANVSSHAAAQPAQAHTMSTGEVLLLGALDDAGAGSGRRVWVGPGDVRIAVGDIRGSTCMPALGTIPNPPEMERGGVLVAAAEVRDKTQLASRVGDKAQLATRVGEAGPGAAMVGNGVELMMGKTPAVVEKTSAVEKTALEKTPAVEKTPLEKTPAEVEKIVTEKTAMEKTKRVRPPLAQLPTPPDSASGSGESTNGRSGESAEENEGEEVNAFVGKEKERRKARRPAPLVVAVGAMKDEKEKETGVVFPRTPASPRSPSSLTSATSPMTPTTPTTPTTPSSPTSTVSFGLSEDEHGTPRPRARRAHRPAPSPPVAQSAVAVLDALRRVGEERPERVGPAVMEQRPATAPAGVVVGKDATVRMEEVKGAVAVRDAELNEAEGKEDEQRAATPPEPPHMITLTSPTAATSTSPSPSSSHSSSLSNAPSRRTARSASGSRSGARAAALGVPSSRSGRAHAAPPAHDPCVGRAPRAGGRGVGVGVGA